MTGAPRWPGPLERSFLGAAVRGGWLATAGLVGVGTAVLAGQTLLGAAVVPGPAGGVRVVLGLLPAVLALALPVGVFLGVASAGRAWTETGQLTGLAGCGWGARRLVAALLLLGGISAGFEAVLTHVAEPFGRAGVRRSLEGAVADLRLRPGVPVQIGALLVHAEEVQGGRFEGVFLASGDLVMSGRRGWIGADGRLVLEQGAARRVDAADGSWSVVFERASVPVSAPQRRVELAERGWSSLTELVGRMRAEGRAPVAEALALYKRTALALSLPLLALLGLPLGARGVRPAVAAVATVLSWWVALRLCDQAATVIGPTVAALVPPGLLAVAAGLAWSTWRAR